MNTLISIIIPNYNREYLIAESLESIIAQTYQNWECIVVDDHSTDKSWEVVDGFCKKDKRFVQVRRPNNLSKGACSCRNYGFEMSKGSYISWFDSDDIMLPAKLEKQLRLAEIEKSDLVICQTRFFETDVSNLKHFWNANFAPKHDPLTDYITFRLAWSTNAPLWKKTFLESKDLFNINLTSSQDWEFHARMLSCDPKFSVVNKTLVFNRMHLKRIGVSENNNRNKIRFDSRLLVFDELMKKKFFNKEIKNYFRAFFMNQLKYVVENENYLELKLIPAIKWCTNSYKWHLNFYPRIVVYLFIFRTFGKRHLTYKYLIKQLVNQGRI